MCKIEKNVPIPDVHSKKRKYPLPQMEVGDSFFIKGTKKNITGSINFFRIKHPEREFTIRKVDAGVRVWRVR